MRSLGSVSSGGTQKYVRSLPLWHTPVLPTHYSGRHLNGVFHPSIAGRIKNRNFQNSRKQNGNVEASAGSAVNIVRLSQRCKTHCPVQTLCRQQNALKHKKRRHHNLRKHLLQQRGGNTRSVENSEDNRNSADDEDTSAADARNKQTKR